MSTWSNITVASSLAPDLPLLHCDREGITQILINLLTNARDAMPGGGEIAIRSALDPEKKHILLQVSDTGVGIPLEAQAKIFDPFFTTKEVGSGTGLGLPVVRGIVEAHGGKIELQSAPGAGTTFTLRFPAHQSQMPPPPGTMDESGRYDGTPS